MSSYKAINESWHRFLTEVSAQEEEEDTAPEPEPGPEISPAAAENDEDPEGSRTVFGINSDPEINPESLKSMLEPLVTQNILSDDQKEAIINVMLKAAEEDDVVLEAIGGPDRDPRTFSPNTTRELNAVVASFRLIPSELQKLEKTIKMWARLNTVKFSAPAADPTAPTEPDTDIELPPADDTPEEENTEDEATEKDLSPLRRRAVTSAQPGETQPPEGEKITVMWPTVQAYASRDLGDRYDVQKVRLVMQALSRLNKNPNIEFISSKEQMSEDMDATKAEYNLFKSNQEDAKGINRSYILNVIKAIIGATKGKITIKDFNFGGEPIGQLATRAQDAHGPDEGTECDAILNAYPQEFIDKLSKDESVRGELRELARSTALLADATAIASYLLAAGTAGTGVGIPVAGGAAIVGTAATTVGTVMDVSALTMSAMLLQPKEIVLDLISFLPWVGGKLAKVTKKAFPTLFKTGAKISAKAAAKGVNTAVKQVSAKAGGEVLEDLMTEALTAKIGKDSARAFAKTTITIGELKVKKKVQELQARLKIDIERETGESDEDYNRRIKGALKEYAKEEQRRLDTALKKCIRNRQNPIFTKFAGAIEGLTDFIDFLDDGLEWVMNNAQEYFANDEEQPATTEAIAETYDRWQTIAGINKRIL